MFNIEQDLHCSALINEIATQNFAKNEKIIKESYVKSKSKTQLSFQRYYLYNN